MSESATGRAPRTRSAAWIPIATVLLAAVSGCGAVPTTEPARYRIIAPQVAPVEAPPGGVLRVADPEVIAELSGDRMHVADGPVRLLAWRGHRFAAPIDRLVGDALVAGLRQSGVCDQVWTALEPGDADRELRVRVTGFHQDERDGVWAGVVTLDITVLDADRVPIGTAVVSAATPLDGATPEALAVALSTSLERVIGELAEDVSNRARSP